MAKAQSAVDDGCAKCGRSGVGLYWNPTAPPPGQARELLCFACLDAGASEVVSRYPGWREREAAQQKRAKQAKLNFGHS